MADRMLQFVHLPQQQPPKRPVSARREDFAEIYRDFDPARGWRARAAAAASAASRSARCIARSRTTSRTG